MLVEGNTVRNGYGSSRYSFDALASDRAGLIEANSRNCSYACACVRVFLALRRERAIIARADVVDPFGFIAMDGTNVGHRRAP